jgi:hypothetical protein
VTSTSAPKHAAVDDQAAGGTDTRTDHDQAVTDAQIDVQVVTTALDGWPARLSRRLTPPEPWRHRPASLAAMSRYAHQGGWTGNGGPLRFAGVWYFRLVAVPVAVITHYLAWIVARPSRLATALLVYTVLAHIGPLRWLLWWPSWL